MRAKFTALISILLICGSANAQIQEEKNLSRGQIYTYLGFSMVANLATVNGLAFMDSTSKADYNYPWWEYAAIGAHHLPMYGLNPKKALMYTATDASLLGVHLATKKYPLVIFKWVFFLRVPFS